MAADVGVNQAPTRQRTSADSGGEGRSVSGSEWEEMVSVGCVARAHGNAGRVIINPNSDFIEERFRAGNTIYVRHGDHVDRLLVKDVRFHRHRPIVSFAEVETMTAAAELASAELRVPVRALSDLPDDTFYHHELIRCRVLTVDGTVVGTVIAVEDGGGVHRLVVDNGSAEIQVPLVLPICERIDPEAGVITINPPEGLLDLNLPPRCAREPNIDR